MSYLNEAWTEQLRHTMQGLKEESRAGRVIVQRDARACRYAVSAFTRLYIREYVLNDPGYDIDSYIPLFATYRGIKMPFCIAYAKTTIQGLDDISLIEKHAPSYGKLYTDDGWHIPDAYGPPYVSQRDAIVAELSRDGGSRRAAAVIYRHPEDWSTVGVSCTLCWTFQFHKNVMFVHSFMRSSDVWVGLPNDMFVVASVAEDILSRMGKSVYKTELIISISSANSHVYERHWEKAVNLLSGNY
jgi:hypothetical protein